MGKIVEGLQQNTPQWLEWRKNMIGASEAAAILGVSKWCTPWQLYMRKLGLIPEQADNYAMGEGRRLEPKILESYNREWGLNLKPVVIQSFEYPWMFASLDGWDEDARIAVEIKTASKEDHACALEGCVPDHYFPQVQHQHKVLGEGVKLFYISANKEREYPTEFEVKRDDEYIKAMIEKEVRFMEYLKMLIPPEFCDRDFVENNSREWQFAVRYYENCKRDAEHAEDDLRRAREAVISLAGDHNCKGAGFRVTKSVRRGQIDYQAWIDDQSIEVDWDQYRKPPITTWRVTEE
jgi:putative phage-type endonuclease